MRTRIIRPPRWRASFLRALSRTGNVKLSAERAPVHHSHVYRLRKNDAEFAAAWDAARAEAALLLADNPWPSVARCTGDTQRGELILTKTRWGNAHLRVPRANGWTRAKEAVFLKTLACTCNVLAAAKAAGVTTSGAYQRRMRWAGFEAAWAEALDNGMATLEARLLETTINRFAGSDTLVPYADKIAMPLSQADMANAISLLTIHRRQLAGGAKRGGCLKRATEEETYYLLMKRIRQMEAANSRMAQRAAKAAALRSPNGNASETAVSDWPPLVCPS